ncbi:type II toxin-antitoxin system HigB family toxin [Thiohalorhabdus sp.]|uniref:type II toxin-antitoxin system HigB family toxin n=1 Tax=Thiohalorhabdus sp. TaxID=3094134 RepID=UPI002FC2B5AD
MHVITQKRIWEAKERWPESSTALDAWYRLIKSASPQHFADMQQLFPSVHKVGNCHVFDLGGNKIRLIAKVQYRTQKVFIRYVLDHPEYDREAWKDDC